MPASLIPVCVVLFVVATDLWVYFDASRCTRQGSPVYLRIGTFHLETPTGWFFACLVLWIFFFPLYFASRSAH